MNRRFGADVVARARLVLDDELLAQPFRQPLRHDARRDVRAPARGIGHDPTHRPGRIVERRGGADPAPPQSRPARGKTTGKIHAWDDGARLLLPAFVGANDAALAVAVLFANLRAKVRGIGALAQGRWVMRPAFEKLRDCAQFVSPRATARDASINQTCRDFRPCAYALLNDSA